MINYLVNNQALQAMMMYTKIYIKQTLSWKLKYLKIKMKIHLVREDQSYIYTRNQVVVWKQQVQLDQLDNKVKIKQINFLKKILTYARRIINIMGKDLLQNSFQLSLSNDLIQLTPYLTHLKSHNQFNLDANHWQKMVQLRFRN